MVLKVNLDIIWHNSQKNGEKLVKSSKLSLKVYNLLLDKKKPLKPDEIANLLEITLRSARYAVNRLYEQKIVSKIPDLEDLRTSYYVLNKIPLKNNNQTVNLEA